MLRHPAFLAGELHTAFLAEHAAELLPADADKRELPLAALAAALAQAAAHPGPLPAGWRNLPSQSQVKRYRTTGGEELTVSYRLARDGLLAEEYPGVRLLGATSDQVVLELDGVRRTFRIARYGSLIEIDTSSASFSLTALPRFAEPVAASTPGALLAPMPGTVIRLGAALGERVTAYQPLLWLEAMKMEHQVAAPADGTVVELRALTGQQVDLGAVLAVVEPIGPGECAGPGECVEPSA